MRTVLFCAPHTATNYRYRLDVQVGDGPRLCVVQKNPSRADAVRRDPTVHRVEAWARAHGFGVVSYLNLFAWRSPEPMALNTLEFDTAVGLENDRWIAETVDGANTVVAAWGNANGIDSLRYGNRIRWVLGLLTELGVTLQVVGPLTQLGQPRHGLRWQLGMGLQPIAGEGLQFTSHKSLVTRDS